MESLYQPLSSTEFETRILEIMQDSPQEPIRLKLNNMSLMTPVQYSALSYCWGPAIERAAIIVNNTKTHVSLNLLQALSALRTRGVKYIWVDALCINQADKQEKSLQIGQMAAIYAKADLTYAWLGDGTRDDTGKAIRFMVQQYAMSHHTDAVEPLACYECSKPLSRTLTQPPTITHCQGCNTEPGLKALCTLFQRPYWRRCWILQEVSASQGVHILAGVHSIPLEKMNAGIDHCRTEENWETIIANENSWFDAVMKFRRSYNSVAPLTLREALHLSKGFETTEPRDAIFALLGMTTDGSTLIPLPNYFEPMEKLMTDLTRKMVQKTRRLDELVAFANGCSGQSRVQRSWTIDWLHADIGAGTKKAKPDRGLYIQDDMSFGRNNVLQVTGFAIGKIQTVTSSICDRNIVPGFTEVVSRSRPVSREVAQRRSPEYYSDPSHAMISLLACLLEGFRRPRYNHHPLHNTMKPFAWRTTCHTRVLWRLFYHTFIQMPSNNLLFLRKFSRHIWYNSHDMQRWCKINADLPMDGQHLADFFGTGVRKNIVIGFIARTCATWYTLTVLLFFLLFAGGFIGFVITISPGAYNVVGVIVTGTLLFFTILCFSLYFLMCPFWIWRFYRNEHQWAWDLEAFFKSKQQVATTEEGILCSVPGKARVGDHFYLLVGSASPVVLREVSESDNGRRVFQLVGPGYIAFNRKDFGYYKAFWDCKSKATAQQQALGNFAKEDKWATIDLI